MIVICHYRDSKKKKKIATIKNSTVVMEGQSAYYKKLKGNNANLLYMFQTKRGALQLHYTWGKSNLPLKEKSDYTF